MRARETIAHELDQHLDGETVRQHDRLGAAIAGCGEQLERAAPVGLGIAPAA
jgi:hypothetical protein